jgi:NADH-quinone oxidoreductase subunit N
MGKFYALVAGIEAAGWLLVILLVLTSAVGLFYYLRVVLVLSSSPLAPERGQAPVTVHSSSWAGSLVPAVLMLGLVRLGVYPAPLIHAIRLTAATLL